MQEGLVSPFQQKLEFTQMLYVFSIDISHAYISISILHDKDPFLRDGHKYIKNYFSTRIHVYSQLIQKLFMYVYVLEHRYLLFAILISILMYRFLLFRHHTMDIIGMQ